MEIFKTSYISFAIYLKYIKKIKMDKYVRRDDNHLTFYFHGTGDDKKEYEVEFLNSESKLFDSGALDFKKLIRG